ncbi:MBL fold metallo-hydrolase [Puia sp. P3]|uniref:MBL fold metallo-hydrolase n=1 Tax=Puia sp. P3 TaxID=3423952 RepID=UPI003D67A270
MNNPPLKITFLGTGTSTGVPMIACPCAVCASTDNRDKRLRSSILVQSPATTIVVDTTPDFRYQMLRQNIRELDAVIFTHPHKDHLAGLDDVRAFNFFQRKAMNLYANEMTQETIVREFPYAFADMKYPGIPDLRLNDIDKDPFLIGDITIQPIQVWHMKMPVLGFRFGDFTYITDANRIDEERTRKDKRQQTDRPQRPAPRETRFPFLLGEAIDEVRSLGVPEAWFTHVSHQLGKHTEVEPDLPKGMHLAYDGLVVEA